ncbi:MAG: HAMP domain-containing histidine kinase [Rhodospirillales bacterium]|nr:HAMP domain-containing histidine kinase [Rhodospirillales bacterium]MCW8861837.1 HAMP domain-containing histidine kinase [Rhodospirillales bacterium]MCW8951726.1 HAMP domain-containing histidine kinase [Rhodospirillales bacterium]MCW8969920.1 HAMP domain-containing histidine kinase [Rhodospirillales bacterium]MCW9003139.1 HAMP domain-containing histidine kinase [Rhodospirillales bacterium]
MKSNDPKNALREAERALAGALARERDNEWQLAELAHELRTPLSAMLTGSEVIAGEHLGPLKESYRNQAQVVHTAAQQLLAICDRILSEAMAREKGETRSIIKEVNAASMVKDVHQLFAGMAEKRNVKFSASLPPNFPILHTDPVKLHQVLSNVVSNAIKFTPSRGKVTISGNYDSKKDAAIIVVADQGRGMSAMELMNVMQPFVQVDDAAQHGDSGTGLGLAISARLMKELGGRLEVRSQEGVGTVVALHIPPKAGKSKNHGT